MNEFDIIKTYFQSPRLAWSASDIVMGIGDDCAILSPVHNSDMCFSMDTLVEGVHFPIGANAFDVGTRAMCVTLSDLAAMGATPSCFTLALTLPEQNLPWIEKFADGLASVAQSFQCPLVGGDTTRGETLTISIQVHGWVTKGKALRRTGAKVGDQIYVSGHLGDAAGALTSVLKAPTCDSALAKRFYRPEPEIVVGQHLLGIANACIDVSDGLVQDLQHICQASQVGMKLNADQIPLSEALISQFDRPRALEFALRGGDDYRLAFTAPKSEIGICIGQVIEGHDIHIEGLDFSLASAGYQHF